MNIIIYKEKLMKNFKYFIIGILCFCNICIARAEVITNYNNPVIYKTVLFKNGEKDANEIVYDYILKETPAIKSSPSFSIKTIAAYKIDLNNDGVNEIIATSSWFHSGKMGAYNVFILQKQKNNNYKDISLLNTYLKYPIYILKHKTNGYHDIKTTATGTKYNINGYFDGQWYTLR